MCKLEKFNDMMTTAMVMALFRRTVAITCTVSKITVTYNNLSAIFKYEIKIEEYEHTFRYTPTKRILDIYFHRCHCVFLFHTSYIYLSNHTY